MLQSDRHWPVLYEAIGRTDLSRDPRFTDAATRREHGQALVAILDTVLETKTRAEWAAIFDAADIFWGPVQTIEDVIREPRREPMAPSSPSRISQTKRLNSSPRPSTSGLRLPRPVTPRPNRASRISRSSSLLTLRQPEATAFARNHNKLPGSRVTNMACLFIR